MDKKRYCKFCNKDISDMHYSQKFCQNKKCQKLAKEERTFRYLKNKFERNSILDKIQKDMEE